MAEERSLCETPLQVGDPCFKGNGSNKGFRLAERVGFIRRAIGHYGTCAIVGPYRVNLSSTCRDSQVIAHITIGQAGDWAGCERYITDFEIFPGFAAIT